MKHNGASIAAKTAIKLQSGFCSSDLDPEVLAVGALAPRGTPRSSSQPQRRWRRGGGERDPSDGEWNLRGHAGALDVRRGRGEARPAVRAEGLKGGTVAVENNKAID